MNKLVREIYAILFTCYKLNLERMVLSESNSDVLVEQIIISLI